MDLIFLVGNIALVCTIAASFSGLPLILEFFQKKSTGNASVLPFLAAMTCLKYHIGSFIGIPLHIIEDSFVQVPNLISATISGFQLALIAVFPSKKLQEKED
ncbi:hypothetical protein HNY73_002427 [Argiope bruennichi]|uniref:Uncharacterized protein n=1 Tax=Argiope bruennichi TaxID=94029 RepID=A0A8T0FUK1_ARGBR|nr:hypothetical protein HNY73_002427 [Argiope bruennichi]